MIKYDDILNLNFYKKEKFTGSYQGMRYLIKKDEDNFIATIWPGPYNYETTPDAKKTVETFPFTKEGKQELVDWMNEQWKSRREEWPER